jgi:hypothetical protein
MMIDSDIYFLNVEIGGESIKRENTYSYAANGNFFKIGIAKNLSPFDQERNYFTLGINYARSSFSNSISFIEENTFYGNQTINLNNNGLSARWWEINGGIRIRIWEQLYFGYVVRLKMFKDVYGIEGIEPWDVPGFGRHKRSGTSVKSTTIGLNYHISWRIPYRKKPVPVKPKIK